MVDWTRTRVAIRERDTREIIDLALALIRREGWALLRWWLLGMFLPFFLIQAVILLAYPRIWTDNYDTSVLLILLGSVAIAALFLNGVTSGLITAHLGLTVFDAQPSFATVLRIWLSGLGSRLVTLLLPFSSPMLNEVIFLERLSFWRRADRVRFRQRLKTLASYGLTINSYGGLQAWLTVLIAVLTILIVFATGQVVGGSVSWGLFLLALHLGLAIAGGYLAVVRFLTYLNVRIKYEGWDVELAMRAAAARLASPNHGV